MVVALVVAAVLAACLFQPCRPLLQGQGPTNNNSNNTYDRQGQQEGEERAGGSYLLLVRTVEKRGKEGKTAALAARGQRATRGGMQGLT